MLAHDEGFRAGKAGEPEQRCPYRREDIKRRDWRRGWERGRNSNKHISPDHEPNMPAKGQTRARRLGDRVFSLHRARNKCKVAK